MSAEIHAYPSRPRVLRRGAGGEYLRLASAAGVRVRDETGRTYLDGISGAFVANLGYGHERIVEAMARQARTLSYAHNSYAEHEPLHQLAERLAARAGDYYVYLCGSGSEAVEAAIRVTHAYHTVKGRPERTKIAASDKSYHGATAGALSLSGANVVRLPYEAILPPRQTFPTCFCPECPAQSTYPRCGVACAGMADSCCDDPTTAALIIEAMSANVLGAFLPPPEYLPRLSEVARRADCLLIVDEIATSGGRTGLEFAFQHAGDITPDMICVSKSLGAGYANIGALLVHGRVAEVVGKAPFLLLGHTYNGNPIGCATALAVLDEYERGGYTRSNAENGEYLLRRLRQATACTPIISAVRGQGLLAAIDVPAGRVADGSLVTQVVTRLVRARGVLVMSGYRTFDAHATDHVIVAPAFVSTPTDLDEIAAALGEVSATLERTLWDFGWRGPL